MTIRPVAGTVSHNWSAACTYREADARQESRDDKEADCVPLRDVVKAYSDSTARQLGADLQLPVRMWSRIGSWRRVKLMCWQAGTECGLKGCCFFFVGFRHRPEAYYCS